MSEWVDDEDAVHDGWEYVGSLSGPYDELKGFYCPDDGKFYVDRYHWNREGDERYYDGYDEYPPHVIWNSFTFKYDRERLMKIAEKYGVSYGDVKNGFEVWTSAVGIRGLTNDKMLEKGDLVPVGSGAASDDIMPDGRIVTGYYADEKGTPAITISDE